MDGRGVLFVLAPQVHFPPFLVFVFLMRIRELPFVVSEDVQTSLLL